MSIPELSNHNILESFNITQPNSVYLVYTSPVQPFSSACLFTFLLLSSNICLIWLEDKPSRGNKHIFFLLNFFYCCSITVVCIFSPPLHPTLAKPTSLPHLHPPPWFCPCVLYSNSCIPLSPLSPPHSPLAIVRLFLTSMSLVIFCLLFSLVDYVPVKGEIIWYLSLTAWLEINTFSRFLPYLLIFPIYSYNILT